jgi:hypothetical protein
VEVGVGGCDCICGVGGWAEAGLCADPGDCTDMAFCCAGYPGLIICAPGPGPCICGCGDIPRAMYCWCCGCCGCCGCWGYC